MKIFFTTFLLFASVITKAQWSNTTNQFYDSLAMPVCTATGDQVFPLVQRSYPDSGYFVIWEDNRDGFNYSHTQIFAQKYDKSGNQLWANDGVPIATSTFSLHYNNFTANNSPGADFRQSNVADLRNFSFTATDSSNGFYISYLKDSTYGFGNHRYVVMVQHIQGNGTPVFPGEGFHLYTGAGPGSPQLIADGNKGFFVGYTVGLSPYVFCYKDENGVMKLYGGGRVDENDIQDSTSENFCKKYIVVGDASIHCDGNFLLYPNLQGGCEVVMTMHKDLLPGVPSDYQFTAYNELFRVKNDTTVITNDPFEPVINYKKDSVMVLYQVRTRMVNHSCGGPGGSGIVTDVILTSNGFLRVGENHDYAFFAKGALIATDGNININVIGVTERDNTSNIVTKVYYRAAEKYSSLPYAFTIGGHASTLEGGPPPGQNKINWGSDTLFYNANAQDFYNFSLASSKDKIYASSFIKTAANNYTIFLQQLKTERESPDSFAVVRNTADKNGIKIASDNITGNDNTQLIYNPSYISVDNEGHALFYVVEYGKDVLLRASPAEDSCRLEWGSVGKSIRNIYTYLSLPFVAMSPGNGGAVIAWNGFNNSSSQNSDIFIRHLDNLDVGNYLPPTGKVKLLLTGFGKIDGLKHLTPYYVTGASGKWNIINYGDNNPVVGLLDNNNLGVVAVSAYQNWHAGGSIRFYNGQPYLDRDYNITPQNTPTVPQPVRLYFTNEEMDALKAADPTITGPGSLEVVKQPSASMDAPSSYSPASDEIINPSSWGVVLGGYYLEINVNSFSNFFIQKGSGALPVTWLDVNAQWKDNANAIVSWKVATQINVTKYNLQHSYDGVTFTNVCEIPANDNNNYSCIVPAEQNRLHYYRVKQTDIDGSTSFSKVVVLSYHSNERVMVFPNPAANEIRVAGLNNYKEYMITDITGKIMERKIIIQSNVIHVSYLQPGVYLLKLIGVTDSQTFKFIKQ